MGRKALVHSKAPIAQILLQCFSPNELELQYITWLAACDETAAVEDLFLGNTGFEHPLATAFNQSNPSQKRESILLARTYLGDYIGRLNEGTLLNELSQFLFGLFSKAQTAQKLNLAKTIGKTALLKTAMVNPDMAILVFELLLSRLTLEHKKWLSLSLSMEQMIKQTTINAKLITGPSTLDEDNEYISNVVMLYFHWAHLRQNFKKCLDDTIVASDPQKSEALPLIQEAVTKLIENEVEQFKPLVSTFNPLKSPKTLSILQDVAQLSSEQIAWLSLNAYLLEPQAFGNIPKESPLNNVLSILLKKYGRQTLISVLEEKNTKAINQEILSRVESYYDAIVKSMAFDTRRWLFLELLLEEETPYASGDIIAPTGREAALCQLLVNFASQCPIMARLLHQRLNARLPGEGEKLFNIICNYIRYSVSNLNDQMRLWQYLSLCTHSEPQYFSALGSGAHEANMGNVIYKTALTTLSAQLHRMVNYSGFVRTTVYNALLENINQSAEFEKMLSRLPIYKSRSIRTLLSNCEPNTLNWLYFSLLINTHPKESMQLKGKLNILVPKERQWLHAQQVLDMVSATNDAKSVLSEIESLARNEQVEHLRQIKNFNSIYIQAKIKKLSPEAKKWLYYAMKTLSVEKSFKVSAHQVVNLPIDDRSDMAKICYALSNQLELIPAFKDYLLEENPQLGVLQPENDVFSFYACVQSAPGEFSYYESLSEKMSLQIMPMLLKSTAKATKAWLRESLSSGFIDSRQLLDSLPKDMSDQLNHEIALVPNILVLALKWPSVRQFIIQECAGDIHSAKPISGVIVDKLNFSEKGMMALALSLKSHCKNLTHFSAAGTHLSDDALIMLADCLIGQAPLKILQVHQNEDLSSEALSQLLRLANERLSVEHQPYITTAILGCLLDTDVLSWLYVRLSSSQTPMASYLAQASFYSNSLTQEKMKLAYQLLEDALHKPALKEAIIHTTQLLMPQVYLDNQLVYSVINSQDPSLIMSTLENLITQTKSASIKRWLNNALLTGVIEVSGKKLLSEHEYTLMMQLSYLLLVSTRTQRYALAKKLHIEGDNFFGDVNAFKVEGISLSPLLQSALILALHHNADTLSSISIKASALHNDHIDPLCNVLEHKNKVKHLDLSANPIQANGARRIAALLAKNKNIKEMAFNNCECGEEGAIELAQLLPQTGVTKLSLHNSGEIWQSFTPIREKGAKAIAQALRSAQCTVRELDLSDNQLNQLAIRHIVESVCKNNKLDLRVLKLNHNNFGDNAVQQLVALLDKPSLSTVELDGHHATPTALEMIADKLSSNMHICHFEALPNYVFSPLFIEDMPPAEENAAQAKEILNKINERIKENQSTNRMTKQLRHLHLSSSDSMEVEDMTDGLRRTASSPNFDVFSKSTSLVFSSPKTKNKENHNTLRTNKPMISRHL